MTPTNPEEPALWHVAGGVGHIVLNRPDAGNALNAAMSAALCRAIARAARAAIGAIVVSARGTRFCVGGDVHEFAERGDDLDGLVAEGLDTLNPALHTLATLPVPVISAVQGPLGGAGIALALCADIVLASRSVKLRGGYAGIGLSPDMGTSYFLSHRVGAARAKYILMTNRLVTAEECMAWGLVDALYEAEALPHATETLADQLAHAASGSLASIKHLCDTAFEHDLASHLSLERRAMVQCAASADAREGVRAFLEKRAPRFTDQPIR